jgi:predicted RNase H-like HicB family nuclease
MIDLKYSLVIEATEDPTFFGFYSPELKGFTGIGHSIEDCVYQARWGMEEHIALLRSKDCRFPEKIPILRSSSRIRNLSPRRGEIPARGKSLSKTHFLFILGLHVLHPSAFGLALLPLTPRLLPNA